MLPAEALREVERLCQFESYRPGSWLFERGQETNHVFFVLRGVIRVLNYSATGRVVRFASVGPGGIFGELAAIDSLPRYATVVADQPCVVAKMPAKDFQGLIERSPAFAEAPTFKESGYDIEGTGWYALFAPAGIPQHVAARLSGAAVDAMRSATMRARLESLGVEPTGLGPRELAATMKRNYERWGPIIKTSGFTPEN